MNILRISTFDYISRRFIFHICQGKIGIPISFVANMKNKMLGNVDILMEKLLLHHETKFKSKLCIYITYW